jgi:hypothetical protein
MQRTAQLLRKSDNREPTRGIAVKTGPLTRFRRSRCHHRRGGLVVEALMIIPLLVIATIATIEFGSVISLQQTVNQAAIEGARAAAKDSDIDYVKAVVNGVLSQQGISIGPSAAVRLEDPPSDDATEGTPQCPAPSVDLSDGSIRVTVCVPVSATSIPIAGQLADLGFSLVGKTIRQSAVARKE